LENLFISTCPKRRIRERGIRDYRKRRGPKLSVFIHSIYKASNTLNLQNKDYEWKHAKFINLILWKNVKGCSLKNHQNCTPSSQAYKSIPETLQSD
jgi:hypothetical protein